MQTCNAYYEDLIDAVKSSDNLFKISLLNLETGACKCGRDISLHSHRPNLAPNPLSSAVRVMPSLSAVTEEAKMLFESARRKTPACATTKSSQVHGFHFRRVVVHSYFHPLISSSSTEVLAFVITDFQRICKTLP